MWSEEEEEEEEEAGEEEGINGCILHLKQLEGKSTQQLGRVKRINKPANAEPSH